jgi:hypothetical protein
MLSGPNPRAHRGWLPTQSLSYQRATTAMRVMSTPSAVRSSGLRAFILRTILLLDAN